MLSIVGIGGAGSQIVEGFFKKDIVTSVLSKFSLKSEDMVRAVAIDTCESIKALGGIPTNNRVLIGSSRAKGHGTGGDVEMGREIVVEESTLAMNAIRRVNIEKPEVFFLVAGLGGGTGTGGVPYLAERIRKTYQVPIILILVLPSKSEGTLYVKNAYSNLEGVLASGDGALLFDNHVLINKGEDMATAHRTIDQAILRMLKTLEPHEILRVNRDKVSTMGVWRTRSEHMAIKDIIDRTLRDYMYYDLDMEKIEKPYLFIHGNTENIYGQSFAREWVKKRFGKELELVFKDHPSSKYLNIMLDIVGLEDVGKEMKFEDQGGKPSEIDDLLGDIESII
jgi:cell division GTPase FtsZ